MTHEVKYVLWMFLSDLSALVYKAGAPRHNRPPRTRDHRTRTTAPAAAPYLPISPHCACRRRSLRSAHARLRAQARGRRVRDAGTRCVCVCAWAALWGAVELF